LAAPLARPVLDTFYDAPLAPFRVHYSRTGPHAVLGATTDTAADGRPRYVHTAADALTHAWELLIDSLGFPAPVPDSAAGGGLNLYDCYLGNTETILGSSNIIGFTSAETWYGKLQGGDTIRIATSFQVVHNTMAPFLAPVTQVEDPFDLLRITCAHEFFHAIHFTYDLDEKPSWQASSWWQEGTSVWFEDYAFPQVNDWSNLPYYLNVPERSLTYSPNFSSIHPYGGGSMWAFYLVERYGGPGILKDIWDRCGLKSGDNTLAASDSVLTAHGSAMDLAWHEFTSWCLRTGRRHEATSFSQGADWAQVQPTVVLFNYPAAVHFTDGTDNLQSALDPSIPVVTIGANSTPVAALGFAAIAHIPFPSNRPDSSMSFYVQALAGSPVQFHYAALDTSLFSTGVSQGALALGDTSLVSGWLQFDTLLIAASSGVHYAPGDTTGDPLADVTPLLSAALDSAGLLTQTVLFDEPYPNPLVLQNDPGVKFVVMLPAAGRVLLDVFNVAGDRVRSFEISGSVWPPAGVLWDGRNEQGTAVASGLYLCKLTVEMTGSGAREEKLFRVGVVR
jgi:hypothetical protein